MNPDGDPLLPSAERRGLQTSDARGFLFQSIFPDQKERLYFTSVPTFNRTKSTD